MRSLVETPDISSVHLDPVLRGLFLFASLCPWGAGFMAVDVASRPSTYFLDYGLDVAGTGHDRFWQGSSAVWSATSPQTAGSTGRPPSRGQFGRSG